MVPIPTSQKRPFIPVQGVAQVEMVYSYLGQVCENVYHVIQGDGATAPTVAQMQAMAAAFEGWENVVAKLDRNTAVSLTEIVVRDLTTQSGPAIVRFPTAPINGQVGSQAMPGNVTAAIKWSTALRGRSFRGRSYFIGISASHVTGDQLTAGARAAYESDANNLITRVLAVQGCTLVVVSYAHNKFWRDAGLVTPITVATVDPNLDSQRRRLAGRGK